MTRLYVAVIVIMVTLATIALLVCLRKCCVSMCANEGNTPVHPDVTVNPVRIVITDTSCPSSPPADFSYVYKYDVATNEVSDMPAMPPPSYEDVVSSDVATE